MVRGHRPTTGRDKRFVSERTQGVHQRFTSEPPDERTSHGRDDRDDDRTDAQAGGRGGVDRRRRRGRRHPGLDGGRFGGDTAATLKAAALKAVPGGTVYRVVSDAGDGSYEAHMTKADGSVVTVKFDKSLAVTTVEPGMGTGDPAMPGQPTGSSPATTG